MKYLNVEFDAIMATPTCGKSYLCDKYPDRFVDVDEVRLRCKYIVPDNITREELERTKGDRPFERRARTKDYIQKLYDILDAEVKNGKTLIFAPHGESYDYLKSRNMKFCLVYANERMQKEIERRMLIRGNSDSVTKENFDLFETFYEGNIQDTRPDVKYAFDKDEYLEDIIKKFGYKF